MEMSRIKNADPIKRGSSLSSTQINQQFTEVNAAFPMDGDNVRNEGIDQPVFDLNNSHGKSGIILRSSGSNNVTTPEIVHANTATTPPYDFATPINTFTILNQYSTNNIIRVYWQFDHNTLSTSYSTPFATFPNATCWVVWLEWDITGGGSYTQVPHQSSFEEIQVSPATHGAATYKTYASTFIPHITVVSDGSGGVTTIPPLGVAYHRSSYGCWFYKADQDYSIYGLRLMARGLVRNFYNATPATGSATNAWELVDSAAATHQITINNSNLSYLIMRDQ
tara:strand:+ start:2504 stop:3343 length:840 start_codon:yes stop_codon:yes gene_type:complete